MATKKEDMNVADIQAQIAEMLAQAKAEAQAIIDNAKKAAGEMTDEEKAAKKAEMEAHKAYMEELVEVKLFKDTGKYKDDVYVGVNGENVLIKRGERVKIKRKFAEALDNSDRQDLETAELIAGEQRKYEKAVNDRAL